MAKLNRPVKAILFDVGGVVVKSPLLAIESYEVTNGIPDGYINFNIFHGRSESAWKRLERNEMAMDEVFFRDFEAELNDPKMWARFHQEKSLTPRASLPKIDARWLFWEMMRISRELDPNIHPTILKLRSMGCYKLGALTNNYIFPEGHPYRDDGEIRALFDVFISSAEIGMRKPETRIFEYAIKALGVDDAEEVVFMDDLGGNLKAARAIGMHTIKVPLRDTWKAVKELEDLLGQKILTFDSSKL